MSDIKLGFAIGLLIGLAVMAYAFHDIALRKAECEATPPEQEGE